MDLSLAVVDTGEGESFPPAIVVMDLLTEGGGCPGAELLLRL